MAKLAEPLVLPAHLSYSQKSGTSKCSWQYVLERLLRAPSRPSWAAVGGKAVHSASEEWDHWTLENRWETDPKVIEDLWIKHFDLAISEEEERHLEFPSTEWRASGRASKQWPNKEDRAWWDDHGPVFVKSWVSWRLANPTLQIAELVNQETGEVIPGIEVPGSVRLADRDVVFYIDRVFVMPDGTFVILDLKSGSHKPDDGGQLGTYNAGLVSGYDTFATWGVYWMAREGGIMPYEDMRQWPLERLDWEYGIAREIQEQGLFVATPSSLCSGCGVKDACYAKNGKDSDKYPLPWEVSVKPRESAA